LILEAPAKLNLCLHLGPRRDDGLHELVSLFQSISLSDRLAVTEAPADEVICPGADGPNLATAALEALRERGWSRAPLRVEIEKRIPVAAGLGGASADAAALLRLADGEVPDIDEIAAGLGADVPSQLREGLALVGGAGEEVEPLAPPAEYALVLIPSSAGLATADVYAEADRLGLGRSPDELRERQARLREAASAGASPLDYAELLVNDLQPAAASLRPEIDAAVAALADAGAGCALITGSGPTAFGVFSSLAEAKGAAEALSPKWADAVVATRR
jgi:4-diphosphocytidyl-2-C-methyl-D-erythritol kinase